MKLVHFRVNIRTVCVLPLLGRSFQGILRARIGQHVRTESLSVRRQEELLCIREGPVCSFGFRHRSSDEIAQI